MSSKPLYGIGILTVSDRCSEGGKIDISGSVIEKFIFMGSFENGVVAARACLPDEINLIKSTLCTWSQIKTIDVIITTGGTGFAPRDVTPEATKSVIEKEAPGLSLALLSGSLQSTPFAMLSRLVCGIRNRTLIINLPGSPKACMECLKIIQPVIPHAVSLLQNDNQVDEFHTNMIQSTPIAPNPEYTDVKPKHECSHSKSQHECHSKVNVDLVASRNRISPHPMIAVRDAQKIILDTIGDKSSTIIDIKDALGYVLSNDIHANEQFPPFPASMKDGYAVIAADGAGMRKVISAVTAGEPPKKEISSGECVRITTGAPIPLGADAVVQVEDTALFNATDDGKTELDIKILKAPTVGLDIRPVGSDIEKGTKVLDAGTILTPAELGILATLGICQVSVVSRPKIGVLSTGNEIQPPEKELNFGKIRDSNKITLMSLLKENGFEAVDCGIVIDDPTALLEKINEILPNIDVLITSGGVSMGEHDIIADVLTVDLKSKLHFGRIFMKPGKPTKFFTTQFEGKTKFIFGLPGNPVSATVTCHLFVLPALKALSGVKNPYPTIIKVKISQDIDLDERYEYARATLQWQTDDPVPWATLTGNQKSCRMLSMVSANCLLHLPAATESQKSIKRGEIVGAQIIGQL